MAENAGRIWYEFGVETTDVLKAQTVTTKATDSMSNSFKKVDNSVKNFNAQTTKAAQGVRKGVQANLGQAGIQVQQFVGQLQGGQSAMVALAQQSADLGIVLGAPLVGVIVSLGAVLLGTLLPSLMSNKTSADALEKSIEQVKAVMTIGADGVANYADEMKELNKVSQQLAKIKLAEAILNQNEVIKNSSKAIVESAESTSKVYKSTFAELRNLTESVAKDIGGDMNDVAEAIRGGQNIGSAGSYLNRDLDLIAKKFKITRSEALDLGLAMSDVIKKGDAVSIKSLQNVTEDLAAAYGYSNEKITKLASGMVKYFIATNQATDGINELRMALFGKGQAIDEDTSKTVEAANSASNLALSMIEQKVALEQGERAALSFRLQLEGVDEAQKQHILTLYDANEATKKNKEEIDAATAANKQYEESVRKKTESDLAWFNQQEKWLEQQENRKKGKAEGFAQGIIDRGMTEPERFAAELEELTALREQGLINQQLYDQAIVASVENRAEQMKKANEKSTQSQALFNSSQAQLLGSLSSLIGEYANNMEVNDKKSFDKKKKFQTAQAIINTAMAISNAHAAAPPPINYALMAAAGAMGAIQVSAIQNQQYSGGRQYGGPVSNGMYRVNETGVPEVYSQGGKDYLMNTKNANITPLDKAGAGGQSSEYNINFNMQEMTDDTFKQMVVRNADMFVGIIRADKNNRGEQY